MKVILCIAGCSSMCLLLAGCSGGAMRSFTSTKPRVDQQISGNRGFVLGRPSSAPKAPAFTERKVYTLEVELPDLGPGQLRPKTQKPSLDQEIWGNKGYLVGGPRKTQQEFQAEPQPQAGGKDAPQLSRPELAQTSPIRLYRVSQGDTLQKISQKFYGTTKKWPLLFQTNRDKLKTPDKVYPGQVLVIPEVGEYRK